MSFRVQTLVENHHLVDQALSEQYIGPIEVVEFYALVFEKFKNLQFWLVQLTVGTYSDGNLFVVYDIRRQVFPTAPSPTTTHLMVCILFDKL